MRVHIRHYVLIRYTSSYGPYTSVLYRYYLHKIYRYLLLSSLILNSFLIQAIFFIIEENIYKNTFFLFSLSLFDDFFNQLLYFKGL